MKNPFELLLGNQTLALIAGILLLALVLRTLSPKLRKDLRQTLVLLGMATFSMACAQLGVWNGFSVTALANGVALVLTIMALLAWLVVCVFQVVLPRVGLRLPRIAQDLVLTALWLAWGFLWLGAMGMDTSRLFATSAILTGVLAFAMQDTLGNVLGGVALQLDNSLRVGDTVMADDLLGVVLDVHWRYTAIENRNGEQVIIPNSWLMKNRFRVLRAQPDETTLWRRTVEFDVSPEAAPARVVEVMNLAVTDARVPQVSTERAPSAVLLEVALGYNRYAMRYWLTDPDKDAPTDSLVRMHLLAALTRAGMALGAVEERRQMVHDNEALRAEAAKEASTKLNVVQNTLLFAKLPLSEQQALAQNLEHAPFVQGGVLTRQGAVAHWLYLVVHGQAEVLVEKGGSSTHIATLSDGAFFGEMGMLTGEPRSATVVAKTAVQCYRLNKQGFAQVLHARPELAEEISHILTERQRDLAGLVQQSRNGSDNLHNADMLLRIKRFFGLRGHGDGG